MSFSDVVWGGKSPGDQGQLCLAYCMCDARVGAVPGVCVVVVVMVVWSLCRGGGFSITSAGELGQCREVGGGDSL
jgi:hypothetical protein